MAAADAANEARLALEKAKKLAESRAGKTTEERLAEMKAERDAKLAQQAADREAKKLSTPSKSEQADLDRGKKFAEERLAANPDTGAGGIIGSTITKWEYDPKTGKKRTPKEIVDAVTAAVLADKNAPSGISIDPLTGKQQSWTPAQKVNQIMMQLMQNARYEGQGYGTANEVYKYLQKGARGSTVELLANRPELWSLGKETVGTVLDRKYFDEPSARKVFILDPTKNQLTPEQMKTYKEAGAMPIDPVTGFQVLIDEQGRYTLGDQPTGANLAGMDYSKYTPEFESLNYSLEGLSAESMGFGMGSGTTNASGTSNVSGTGYGTGSSSSNLDVMKSILRGMGFNSKIIDSSSVFLNSLLKEGLDYDNAVSIFLNSQDYTLKNGSKIKSPFYEEYGYLNEGLTNPKTAAELYNAVEGYKGIIEKYGASNKFLSQEALKGYVKNNVTVADLDERANMARLKSINADTGQINALIKLGYIGSAADLTDFYMDFKIGKEQLELNRNTGAFTAEAIRRAKSGISFDKTSFERLSAALTAKGLSESQISALAAQGFENISETLNPLTMYSQIYEKTGGTQASNEALQSGLQQELMGEQFLGTASEKRKKLSELATRSFEGRTGFYGGKSNVAGAI